MTLPENITWHWYVVKLAMAKIFYAESIQNV